MQRIAVLDDDPVQAGMICQTLEDAGYVCRAFVRSADLVRQLRSETFDLLVLDWIVPDMGGDEVLRWVRRNLPARLPVLFISARNDEADMVMMLNHGADDYMTKPVAACVLIARVSALLRRAYGGPHTATLEEDTPIQTFGPYQFDARHHLVTTAAGQSVAMTQKEFHLAVLLFQHLGRPLSRAHILDVIWRRADGVSSRTMDTHVSVLRAKLGLRPENGYRITPIYGYGYRLAQVEEESCECSPDSTAFAA